MKNIKTSTLFWMLCFCLIVRGNLTLIASWTSLSSGGYPALFFYRFNQILMDVLFVVLPIVAFKLTKPELKQIWGGIPKRRHLFLGVLIGIVLLIFTVSEARLEDIISSSTQTFPTDRSAILPLLPVTDAALSVLATVIIGPAAEEFFFRGLLFRALSVHGMPVAAAISTLVFTMLHYQNLFFISTVFFSLVLTYIYVSSGSLALCFLIHGSYNLFAQIVSEAERTGILQVERLFDTWHLALSAATLALALIMWLSRSLLGNRNSEQRGYASTC